MIKLGEVAEFARDGVLPNHIKSGTLFVGLENIKKGGGFEGVSTVDEGELASTKFAFTPKHVLYGKLRPYLAKIALPDFEGVCSTDIIPILPGPKLDRRYLAHYLLTPKMIALASDRAAGANLPRLSPRVLIDFPIPLPPIDEQRRIAAMLDKAEELRAKRRAAIALLDQLPQAIFLAMFGDPATNPMGWPVRKVKDVAEIVSGATPRTNNESYWDGDVNWVTPKELSGFESIYIAETERRITRQGLESCAASILPPGSVLFSSRAPIGHTAICAAPMATNQGFKSFVPRPGALEPHFLLFWLRLRRSFLEGLGTGATFKEVSKAVVARIELCVPPFDLQRQFAARVEAIERAKAAHQAALAELDALFASLQHRAFAGELSPADPDAARSNPVAAPTDPDAAPSHPGEALTEPVAAPTEPDAAAAHPGEPPSRPDRAPAEPDSARSSLPATTSR